MPANGYHVLARHELRGFDQTAQDLVLDAMTRGGVGRVSNKGHAILRAPDGGTISVSRILQSSNRALQNTKAALERTFPPPPEPEPRPAPQREEHPLVPKANQELLSCPVKKCEAEFVTEGARYQHVEKEHEKCGETGCGHVAMNHTGAVQHHRIVHEGHRITQVSQARKKKAARKVATAPVAKVKAADAASTLEAIRDLLPPSTREQELEAALAAAEKRVAELEAKLNALKEALK